MHKINAQKNQLESQLIDEIFLMTQLLNRQKYLHTGPAHSILGISCMSAQLVTQWMINTCLSEMLPKGP